MSQYSRRTAADMLATGLGNLTNRSQVDDWLCGWSSFEIQCGVGCSHPQNNLWACGEGAPGATNWNSAGVKNYPSLTEAIVAMVANLHDGRYNALVQAIGAGNITALQSSSAVQADLRTWCGSDCYSGETGSFIATGQAHAQDMFDDAGGGGSSTPVTGQEQQPVGSCRWCLAGLPGNCDTDQICAGLNADGTAYILAGPGELSGTCMFNSYFTAHSQNSDGSAIGKKNDGADSPTVCQQLNSGKTAEPPTTGNPANGLAVLLGFLSSKTGWQRVVKALVGVGLGIFALVLIGGILTGKAEQNPIVRQATKLAAA